MVPSGISGIRSASCVFSSARTLLQSVTRRCPALRSVPLGRRLINGQTGWRVVLDTQAIIPFVYTVIIPGVSKSSFTRFKARRVRGKNHEPAGAWRTGLGETRPAAAWGTGLSEVTMCMGLPNACLNALLNLLGGCMPGGRMEPCK